MKKCKNGHYYDEMKYITCPYCNMETTQEDNELTQAIADINKYVVDDMTIEYEENEQTIPFYGHEYEENEYVVGWLICIEGKGKGRDYRLHLGYNRIGRGYHMDISLPDDLSITRDNHCSIVYEPKSNQFYLVPSKGNIVYHNGKFVLKPIVLTTDDEIRIGNSTLLFVAFCRGDRKW